MTRDAFVYFLTNQRNTVLYIGVTNDLVRRVAEHRLHRTPGFTSHYNCTKLVYFEQGENMVDAIAREKQLKNWRRDWKNALVDGANPDWRDLSADIGVTAEVLTFMAAAPDSAAASPSPAWS